MLSNIRVEPFKRTNSRGTDIGLRVAWDSDTEGEEVFVLWQRDRDGLQYTSELIGGFWELLPAEPGTYSFELMAQSDGESVRTYPAVPYFFNGLAPAEQPIPRPTGVELLGVNGELLGSAREFTGRDLRVRWNSLRADALQSDRVGDRPADQLLQQTRIAVYEASDLETPLRREVIPSGLTEWVYTYAHATEDIPLTADPDSVERDLRIEVQFFDQAGRESIATVLAITWTLRLTATADIDVAATQQFATFTKSSGFAVLDTDNETETYGPASMQVFDASAVVRALIRINFDMACTFPDVGSGVDANTKNQVIFEVLRRPFGGADTVIDTFQYDMHITYPQSSSIPGRISIPSFSVYDTPGGGLYEYRVRISINIAQGGASSAPTLSFQGVLLNLEVQQALR